MVQHGTEPRLLPEPSDELRIVVAIGVEQLERDRGPGDAVVGQVGAGKPAPAEQPLDPVGSKLFWILEGGLDGEVAPPPEDQNHR